MNLNLVLPFLSAAVMGMFAVNVLQRYIQRRAPHFLFWGIGLALFGAASFAEAVLSLAWNPAVFFVWYYCGAVLTAAWIGQGTLYLLFRKPWVHAVTATLVFGSVVAGALLAQAMPALDTSAFTSDRPISEQYSTRRLDPGDTPPPGAETATLNYRGEEVTVVRGLLPLGAPVRLTTPFFNIYGTLALVGGAIWSAYLFWRKRVLPNRVIGNILIAAGALSIGLASTLTRLGVGRYLYLGELLAAVLMFVGFQAAARPATAEERVMLSTAQTS